MIVVDKVISLKAVQWDGENDDEVRIIVSDILLGSNISNLRRDCDGQKIKIGDWVVENEYHDVCEGSNFCVVADSEFRKDFGNQIGC